MAAVPSGASLDSNPHYTQIKKKLLGPRLHGIIQDIDNNIKGPNNNEDIRYYMSKSFQNPFPNIKFKNSSTKEIERIIRSQRLKNSHGYDGISTKILNLK
jgi:hypothetical protein